MRRYSFVTVDVFTSQRFGGNPLAVFPDASGMSDAEMQSFAAEFNLSETTFVLPPGLDYFGKHISAVDAFEQHGVHLGEQCGDVGHDFDTVLAGQILGGQHRRASRQIFEGVVGRRRRRQHAQVDDAAARALVQQRLDCTPGRAFSQSAHSTVSCCARVRL